MEFVNVGCNYRHSSSFYINRPYGSGDYLLLIIRSKSVVTFGDGEIPIPRGSALIFKKGTPQYYRADGEEYVNDWIHFDLEEGEEVSFSALEIPFDTVIPLEKTDRFCEFIQNIFLERYSENPQKQRSMKCWFDLLLCKLSEEIHRPRHQNEHPYYERFCRLREEIRMEPQKDWSVPEISRQMHLSRSYVQHLYKLFFNTSIVSEVQSGRMESAGYLLASTDMTVGSVAQHCGYASDVHFMRIFKNVTGMTPSEYRQRHRVSPSEIRKSKNRNPFSD